MQYPTSVHTQPISMLQLQKVDTIREAALQQKPAPNVVILATVATTAPPNLFCQLQGSS